MSFRLPPRLRAGLPGLLPLLASWRLSVVLTVALAVDYAHLVVFARSSPAEVVGNIASLAPFWAVYALLLLNTGTCLWLRLPQLRRELSPGPQAHGPPSWELPAPGLDAAAARALLHRLGYRGGAAAPERVWGLKRRGAGLGTYLFHGSFFVLLAAFATTLAFREEFRLVAVVGEEYTGDRAQVLARQGSPVITLGLPPLRFTHQKLEPEFWNDQLLFTRLVSTLKLEDGSEGQTAINRPLWLSFGQFLRLSSFGYAPRYELRATDGHVIDSAILRLNVFPPGARDHFRPEQLPHRFYLQLYPDLELEGGQPGTRSMNLVNPGIQVHVQRGRVDLGGRLLRQGEAYAFEGMSVRFPEVRYWGEFVLLRDPGAPVLGFGFLMALAGLALRVRGRRAEADWVPGDGGGTLRGWGGLPPRLAEQKERRG